MKSIMKLGPFVAVAVAIALILSWIGELDGGITTDGGEPVSVFSDRRTRTLAPETIVDELISLGLVATPRRVSVKSSVLEVDLEVPTNTNSFNPEGVLDDIGALAKLALAESDNISRVIVRVREASEERGIGRLLIALSGAKTEFRESELQQLRDGEKMPVSWLGEKMRVTETERWKALTIQ